MYRKVEFIWPLLFAVGGFALDATVVKESGTIVVIGLSKNKIVVAADSRGNYGSGEYNDHVCKIIAFNNQFVFAVTGRAGLLGVRVPNSPEPIGTLDTREEAKLAFSSIPLGSNDFLANVAVLWGRRVRRVFRQDISLTGAQAVIGDLPEGPIIRGFFIGSSPKGLQGYMETIYRQGTDVAYDLAPSVLPLSDAMNYIGSGEVDVVGQLNDRSIKWVQEESAQWDRQSIGWPEDERDVLKAIRWVLTLAAYPRSDNVGGPIDSLIIKPGTGVYWRTRKGECQANE